MSRDIEFSCGFIIVTFILTITNNAHAVPNKLDGHQIKTRRETTSGLIAFPRVGRGYNDVTWNGEDLTDPDNMHEIKRNLMAFPRVGRNSYLKKATADRDGINNMWFGPRLGRFAQKRESEIVPWSFFSFRGLPNMALRRVSEQAFTPRLGRESNEDTSNYEEGNGAADDEASQMLLS